jgi:hypothetical protein
MNDLRSMLEQAFGAVSIRDHSGETDLAPDTLYIP